MYHFQQLPTITQLVSGFSLNWLFFINSAQLELVPIVQFCHSFETSSSDAIFTKTFHSDAVFLSETFLSDAVFANTFYSDAEV